MKRNRKEIPNELLPKRRREVESSIFAFHDEVTLVSYVPKKNRAVIALSTEHHYIKIGGEEVLHKPDIILHYNATKGGVDTIDKMINEYSTR
jgi:CO dehydrogenase/acetyl-CoA synthase gamma subunit (corrinoid Fe-S protein)